MYVTNGRLELFLIENPDLKDMVSYLTECPKNVLLTLEYSDFFYEKADSLLMSGLVELHGDRVFMSIYDVFEDMEDDLIEALEAAPLTSINLIPDKLINSKILTLYAEKCLIKGFDKLDLTPEMLFFYYDIAADDFNFEDVEIFNVLWHFDNLDIKNKLMKRFLRLCSYGFHYDNEILSTLIKYFKENYSCFEINGNMVYHLACYEKQCKSGIDIMEYYNIYKECNKISYEDVRWLLRSLFKNKLYHAFEEIVEKVTDWGIDFIRSEDDKKMEKRIEKILKKSREK
ncbi:MAG: hypothetical protein ACI3ZZ_06010 [Candidatus Aphodosoma sp.]